MRLYCEGKCPKYYLPCGDRCQFLEECLGVTCCNLAENYVLKLKNFGCGMPSDPKTTFNCNYLGTEGHHKIRLEELQENGQ